MKNTAPQYVRALIVFVCIAAFSTVKAQFYPPSTPNTYTGNTLLTPPPNSGNDAAMSNGNMLHVMVWDGTSPRVFWKDNVTTGGQAIMGASLGTVTDPDVVIDPSGSGKVLIVYALANPSGDQRIYYEQIQITGATATPILPPTLLSSSVASHNFCSNPNVDVNFLGNVVVTWQSVYTTGFTTQSMIFAKASTSASSISFPATGDGTTISSTLVLGKPATTPDVSIQNNGPLTSIVFNYNDNSTRYLYLRQYNVAALVAGSAPMLASYTLETFPIATVVGRPRIASCELTGTGSNPSDAHVVVQVNTNIYGYTHDAAVYGAGIYNKYWENKPWSLSNCPNTDPATSYIAGIIIDTWNYNDASCGILSSKNTVVARQLSLDGIAINPNYSVLADGYTGFSQRTSSIAGRHASTGEAYYLCWEEGRHDMMYKSRSWFLTNLKTDGAEETTVTAEPSAVVFSVYPNPTENQLHIRFNIAEGETANMVEAFDISGKKVFAADISNASGAADMDVNTAHWSKGVYLVRVTTDQHTHTTKVVKQ